MSTIDVYSEGEQQIINQVRNLKPYEKLVIAADQRGEPDKFVIKRSHMVLIMKSKKEYVETKLHDTE